MRVAVAFVLCLLASGLQGQIRKPSADDLFNEAMKAAQAEDYPKAELWLREMRLSYPQDQRAGTALINVLESANKLGEALRVGRELQVQYKASPAFHMGVGRVLLKLDRVSEALTEFQTALRSAGDAWTKEQAYVLIGDAQRASGNLDAAIASYRQAKDVSGRPQFQLAFSLGERGDVDGEIREYRALLALNPGQPTVLNNLAYTYSERGQNLNEALSYVLQALLSEPNNSYFVDTLGWVYYKQGRFDDAERELVRATRMEDGNSSVHFEHLAASMDARRVWTPERRELRDLLTGTVNARKVARVKELLGKIDAAQAR